MVAPARSRARWACPQTGIATTLATPRREAWIDAARAANASATAAASRNPAAVVERLFRLHKPGWTMSRRPDLTIDVTRPDGTHLTGPTSGSAFRHATAA